MNKRLRQNNHGLVLLLALSVLAIIMALAATMIMRAIENNKITQRNKYSTLAYYEAEAGISYAYAEEARRGFSWYTHENKNTRVTSTNNITKGLITASFIYPVPINSPRGSIDPSSGCYKINGRNFSVKAYPEEINGVYTGIVILLSQGTVNGISRTIEYRNNQVPVYKFLQFYPNDKYFVGATYDGRNYGGIHVNGDIYLQGNDNSTNINLNFLTELSSGANTPGKGYIRVWRRSSFSNLATTTNGETGFPWDYYGEPVPPYDLIYGANNHFPGREYFSLPVMNFQTGPLNSPVTKTLSSYLEGEGSAWDYTKYSGTSLTPLHYTITDNDLLHLAAKEKLSGTGSVSLLSTTNNVNIPGLGQGKEKDIGETMISRDNDTDPNNNVTAEQWNEYWKQWKLNHQDDFKQYHNSGTLIEPAKVDPNTGLTLNRDWERTFFQAADNWNCMGNVPYDCYGGKWGGNREWWQDMEYGNDRTEIDYKAPATVENTYTGLPTNKYFLNTELQGPAFEAWLATNSLNSSGENKTLVQDRNTGGRYINPGKIFGPTSTSNVILQKAQEGGIYIGRITTGQGSVVFDNPIADCTQPTQFYNPTHPAREMPCGYQGWGCPESYRPSSVLKIDVAALKTKIDTAKATPIENRTAIQEKLANFNGVIYVDLTGFNWSSLGTHYDDNADGVMLTNGARLPDGGLSLGTANNVYVKGDYNLDPDGVASKNREKDDTAVTNKYSSLSLKWQPAEVISKRAIYTVSNYFPEPKTMPIPWGVNQQYYSERDYEDRIDLVNDLPFPTNDCGSNTTNPYDDIDWVPTANTIRSADANVNKWFTYYRDAAGNPITPPADAFYGSWIDTYWPSGREFNFDTNNDGIADTTVNSTALRNTVTNSINNAYWTKFSYTNVHGSNPLTVLNPEAPSFINGVSGKHIYNLAIMTPYSPQPYTLEGWSSNSRIINGAFIQLPETSEYKLPIPGEAYSSGYRQSYPADRYVYETRFGRNSNPDDIPNANLAFGADSSWREIPNANF